MLNQDYVSRSHPDEFRELTNRIQLILFELVENRTSRLALLARRILMQLKILPIKTKKILPPKDDLYAELKHLPKLKEGDVLVIASKTLAIYQGRTVEKSKIKNQKL